jgi:hypothetical protein
MKFFPKNTLAHWNAAPQTHLHDLADLPTEVFSKSTLEYRKNCGQTSPNDDAVTFYTLNHCASVVRKSFTENEPMPAWAQEIMATYTDVCMKQGERMLHYILSITTREMRHLKTGSTPAPVWSKIKLEYGAKAVDYLKKISSNGNETVAVDTYMKEPPELPVGHYAKALSYAYHHGSWSGGYGGGPWGQVADAVVAYLTGVSSMEMMVDTAYTLAHNNGPIFNKGMMYTMYDNHFMTILDVQRSGQLPDLMLESNAMGVHKTPEAINAVNLLKQYKPHEIKGYVDWKLVDEMRPAADKAGNPNKYHKQTAAQKQPKMKTSSVTATPSKATPSVMTTLGGKKVKVTGTFQVFPGQVVNVVVRVEN